MRKILVLTSLISIVDHNALGKTTDAGIKVWKRNSGDFSGIENPAMKVHPLTIELDSLEIRTLEDPHTKKMVTVRGISLSKVFVGHAVSTTSDTALLHFENSMIIPIPMNGSDAFLAFSLKADGAWSSDFPEVSRPDDRFKDPLPLKFSGNKVIPLKTSEGFNPWRYANSLVGIEFVYAQAYFAQFPAGKTPQAKAGREVFEKRCQYCHGVRQVGARYGWDFAGPLPAFEKRTPRSLYFHVKIPKLNQFERGTRMPTQTDLEKTEAENIWAWLKEAAEPASVKPYRP